MSCFICWRFQSSGRVLLAGFWVVHHHISLSLNALLHPPSFFFLLLFCYLNPRMWNFLSPWLFVDSYDQSSSRSCIFGAFFHPSLPGFPLEEDPDKILWGVKGFLANCRDFLPPFCLELYKQNIPEASNTVWHQCLVKNIYFTRGNLECPHPSSPRRPAFGWFVPGCPGPCSGVKAPLASYHGLQFPGSVLFQEILTSPYKPGGNLLLLLLLFSF